MSDVSTAANARSGPPAPPDGKDQRRAEGTGSGNRGAAVGGGGVRPRLKHLLRLQYGTALAADAREEGEYNVYGSNGPIGTHVTHNTKVPAIIVGRKGSFGKVVWAKNGGFCIDTAYFVDDRYCVGDLRFSYYALLHLRFDEHSKDSAVPGLDRNDAHNSTINVPTLATQRRIADFLDRETARIGILQEKTKTSIDRLREYRAALITGAVTGQVPVVDQVPGIEPPAKSHPKITPQNHTRARAGHPA